MRMAESSKKTGSKKSVEGETLCNSFVIINLRKNGHFNQKLVIKTFQLAIKKVIIVSNDNNMTNLIQQ